MSDIKGAAQGQNDDCRFLCNVSCSPADCTLCSYDADRSIIAIYIGYELSIHKTNLIESQKGFTLMKKQWIALLTGCVLVCSMRAGCGSKPQTSAPAAAGSDKGCTDEAILSQLKNDGTPEFVLDGTYYTLPLETSQLIQAGWSLETEEYDAAEVSILSQLKNDGTPEFVLDGTYYTLPLETSQLIQAGWSLETEEYDAAEVSMQPGERIYGELSKDDQEMDVAIVNAGTAPCKPAEGGTVVELEYFADKDQPNPDFFVTLNGINCAMSNEALQKALEGVDGYELNSAGNIDINRTVDDDEIAVYKVMLDDDYTAITLASDNIFEYKDYQPQEMKEQVAGTEPCKPAESGTVVELEYSADKNQPNPDFFVTLNGINCAMSNAALQKALEGVDGYELNSAGNIDINRTVDDDEIAVYKVMLGDDYTAITLASDNIFEYKDYQPQEVKEQVSDEKIAAYKDTTKAEMAPYAQDFNAIIEGYEDNMSVGFYSEGTVWDEEVGEYKAIAGTPLSPDVSLYIAEDTTGQLYCIANQLLNEDGTVSSAIELEEGDQVKVWGYASQYLELQEGLKIVVVQPGIIERNGELVILDKNLKAD